MPSPSFEREGRRFQLFMQQKFAKFEIAKVRFTKDLKASSSFFDSPMLVSANNGRRKRIVAKCRGHCEKLMSMTFLPRVPSGD